VIVCDNFEGRALGSADLRRAIYKNTGWAASDGGSMVVSNTEKFDGSRSLEFRFPGGSWGNGQDGAGAGYMEVSIGNQTELYLRHYVKWSTNWVFSPIATKHMAILSSGGARAPWAWHSTWGESNLHHIYEPTQTSYDQNVGSPINVRPGQWYCLEMRLKMNSAGSGIVETWVDNVLKASYSNATLNTQGTSWRAVMLSGYWNAPGSHPAMSRWFDNIVVSRERIGCLGSQPAPGPSAVAPAPPSGLVIR
jgi:Polysaccharide lyase